MNAFSRRIAETEQTVRELRNWGLKFGQTLQEVPGRIIPPETILQANNRTATYRMDNAEWSFRDFKLMQTVPCVKWAVLHLNDHETETRQFVKQLVQVSKGGQSYHLGPSAALRIAVVCMGRGVGGRASEVRKSRLKQRMVGKKSKTDTSIGNLHDKVFKRDLCSLGQIVFFFNVSYLLL